MRPADAYQGVDEILQADVMRFLAIISICMIAILALVRSVEPTVVATAAAAEETVTEAVAEAVAEAAVVPMPVRKSVPVPQPHPSVTVRPPLRVNAKRVAVPVRAPAPPAPAVAAPVSAAPPLAATPAPEPPSPAPVVPAPEPAVQPADDSERGLSLRFASDQDFLRLLNLGDIRVFAFREGEVLALGPDFRFQQAAAPGRLHELLPETIPDLMIEALRDAQNRHAFRWGVALPDRIAGQIRGYLDRGTSGELIIDRFGEVHHSGT